VIEPRLDDRDTLTGLPGPEAVRERLRTWGDSGDSTLHALLLGLRRFDAVNLAYGTATGDLALAEVAARLTHFSGAELDGQWLAARAGGGSFLVVANQACSRERWQLYAEQLAEVVAGPIARGTGALRLSPRIALLRVLDEDDGEAILDRLGQALEGIPAGRRVIWADGATTRPGRTAAQLEADLLSALDGDEIEVLFQPQFALQGGALSGAEALARWNHPKLGRMGAGALFAAAERADHVAQLSRHVAKVALTAAAVWPDDLRLSLNVTAADLAEGGYASWLEALLAATGFAPERLTLEVTEQALLGDIQLAGDTLRELAARGIRIALDDFGAGFCNFRYLKLLPLDYLKLDRSMIEGVTTDPRDLAVLRGIVAMAKALDLAVIAEGVESEDQRALLEAEHCAFFQGFLAAQPMSGAEFTRLAAAG
jgi:EAL domain-containing protein (putative c-di-GMP-specific phosphodiesterase class I)/GGDEF domain-containing protein